MQISTQGNPGAESAQSITTLGRCLVEADPEEVSRARRSRGKTFGVSLGIETVLVGLLLVAPLLTGVAQPKLSRPEIAPVIFPGRPPIRAVVRQESPTNERPNSGGHPIFYAPGRGLAVRPAIIDFTNVEPDSPPDEPAGSAGIGAPLLVVLGPSGPAAPTEPAKKPVNKRPLKLSEPVVAAQLISRIEPRYPPLARQLRLSGTVVLHAIIGRDGNINGLQVVSGSPYFVQAALEAVRQWRYRPTLLDGEPVEVETTITVIFNLQS